MLLTANGLRVKLWCYDAQVANSIKATRINERYLPGVILDTAIETTIDLAEAITETSWIFVAIPVKFLRTILQPAQFYHSSDQIWVLLSKGIEQDTLFLPSQILDDVFGKSIKKAVLSGPSFAYDVIQKQPTAVTIASSRDSITLALQKVLMNNYFRPYRSQDMLGVQIGGSLKNVITIGIGMIEGAGFKDNTKAFIFTCGFHELIRCAVSMGAQQETLYGLSGIGDLVLTSMGSLSRNLLVGQRLGLGEKLEHILQETGYIPEGVNTVSALNQLMYRYKLDLPILRGICQIILEGKSIQEFIHELMGLPGSWECF
jgi:glycerol-3-phosphate dehydrogenase (NAD(P)+)